MRAILSCGGTGGHIYPAVAIADKIMEKEPDSEILFIGTKKGMENRIVPASGYRIEGIDASGFNRHSIVANFRTIDDIIKGGHEARQLIRGFRPDVVIGTGGYVTGPVLREASRLHFPCYIHEQNAFAGMANKMLEHSVEKVFISFEEAGQYFKHPEKLVFSGNPIRGGFRTLKRDECRSRLGLAPEQPMLLIFGGSLGAELINESALRLIDGIGDKDIKLYFITGKRYYGEIKESLGEVPGQVVLLDYADDMPTLMKAADLAVSRAGAIAVSEIMACGLPSILIPSPNVTNNHQYYNAKAVADAGAAILLEEAELGQDIGRLAAAAFGLLEDRETSAAMGEKARSLGRTDAAEIIYETIAHDRHAGV